MIKTGKLVKWDKKKGFGFIKFDKEDRQIFVHISAFPKNSGKPQLNETLAFQISVGKEGKPMAVSIQLLDREMPVEKIKIKKRRNRNGNPLIVLIIWGLLVAVGIFTYKFLTQENFKSSIKNSINSSIRWATKGETTVIEVINPQNNHQIEVLNTQNNYQCGGRTHCSHVNSCEEATWVLNNCSGTKMDGDNDGVPCERQWCD